MQDLPPTSTVTYEFHDSSVPPPFHRSFVLTFDRNAARIVVDSYGDVLADRTVPMTDDAWAGVSRGFGGVQGLLVEEPERGCTGGTGFAVSVADGGVTSFALNGLACGGVNSSVSDVLAGWVQPVRALFPSMDQLAPEGR